MFESFVNSERCKTVTMTRGLCECLRALLIQKDVKRKTEKHDTDYGLRALLIQKDVKLTQWYKYLLTGLRALLIQKDVKL